MKQLVKLGVLIGLFMLLFTALSAARSPRVETFEVNPNPMYRNTVVTLTCSELGFLTLWIEDGSGNVVKQLYSGNVLKGVQVEWNRYSDSGEYTPNGTYYVCANYQGRYTSTKKTLILK
ncbi:MAG TPA: FlgD immunoglobulin-like domain containing protein [Candidatus Cloacimonadota bacterium]|nr:FlgD immunoglobulin-like domain containing protein [Candidatus Cloacimonadota bacterium]